VRKHHIPTLTISALGIMAVCIIGIGAWGIFPRARSKIIAPQEQMSPTELSAAIEAQRQTSARALLSCNRFFSQKQKRDKSTPGFLSR
jgi:hypothetical protein